MIASECSFPSPINQGIWYSLNVNRHLRSGIYLAIAITAKETCCILELHPCSFKYQSFQLSSTATVLFHKYYEEMRITRHTYFTLHIQLIDNNISLIPLFVVYKSFIELFDLCTSKLLSLSNALRTQFDLGIINEIEFVHRRGKCCILSQMIFGSLKAKLRALILR